MPKTNLERVREAICEVFGEYIGFKDVTEDGEVLIDHEKVRCVVERSVIVVSRMRAITNVSLVVRKRSLDWKSF